MALRLARNPQWAILPGNVPPDHDRRAAGLLLPLYLCTPSPIARHPDSASKSMNPIRILVQIAAAKGLSINHLSMKILHAF
jgi:hypothetical protein